MSPPPPPLTQEKMNLQQQQNYQSQQSQNNTQITSQTIMNSSMLSVAANSPSREHQIHAINQKIMPSSITNATNNNATAVNNSVTNTGNNTSANTSSIQSNIHSNRELSFKNQNIINNFINSHNNPNPFSTNQLVQAQQQQHQHILTNPSYVDDPKRMNVVNLELYNIIQMQK